MGFDFVSHSTYRITLKESDITELPKTTDKDIKKDANLVVKITARGVDDEGIEREDVHYLVIMLEKHAFQMTFDVIDSDGYGIK